MALKLWNTLTRRKEEFRPIDEADVRLYVCGPTVYDRAHIGNARPVIVFDLLFRLLRHLYGADHVTYVRNITDVDDKINARAAEQGVPIRALTEETADQFHQDIAALGVLPPSLEPRATEHIAAMIAIIERLIARGFAYEAEGHVLFHVPAMPDYGKLSGRSLEEMIAGARVDVAPYKRDPMDFVLWKPSGPDLPGWDSPWGRGRPGWHIECSAMSWQHLGEEFDIHGGGIDLVFPHHENEIAQTRSAFGTPVMAKTWMHNGFLQVEGEKMAKSAGNFVTIHELLNTTQFGGRKWDGGILRLAVLNTYYRQPLDFTAASLREAESKLQRWWNIVSDEALNDIPLNEKSHQTMPSQALVDALSDDLNVPEAMFYLGKQEATAQQNKSSRLQFAADLSFMGCYPASALQRKFDEDERELERTTRLGQILKTSATASANEVYSILWDLQPDEINSKIRERRKARERKDFETADRIRAELDVQGVELRDVKDPVTGELRTMWKKKL
jgi:cysteinyl-tRNA synthetase